MGSVEQFFDTAFPAWQDKASLEDQVLRLTDYNQQLAEYLRYQLSNLTEENFNQIALDKITEPLVVRLENELQGLLTELSVTEGEIKAWVSAQDFQTGDEVTSSIDVGIGKIALKVTSGTAGSSSISLTNNGAAITGSNITLDGALVIKAINGDNSATTSINGGKITTGTINTNQLAANAVTAAKIAANTITGNQIAASTITAAKINAAGLACQYLRASGSSTDDFAYVTSNGFYLFKDGTVKAQLSATSNTEVSWELGNTTTGKNFLLKKFYESNANKAWIGNDGGDVGMNMNFNTGALWMSSQPTYSDRRLKSDIREDLEKYEEFFSALRPATFLMVRDKIVKRHCGFIAQDLQEALHETGLEDSDLAALFTPGMGDEYYGLAYGEFVGLLTHMIQKQTGEIEALEARIAALEA